MIKLVIFDLWQTLAYKKGLSRHYSARKILKETGSKIPLLEFVGIFEEALQRKKWRSKYEAYQNLCKEMGLEANNENVSLIMDIRDGAEERTAVYSYVIPMLIKLKKQGYKIGLISDSSIFMVEQVKRKSKLLDYIDYPLFSYDVGVVKPNLKLYKKMLEMTECKSKETIMIGDTKKYDVIPARKLGMNAIHYVGYGDLKKRMASFGVSIR